MMNWLLSKIKSKWSIKRRERYELTNAEHDLLTARAHAEFWVHMVEMYETRVERLNVAILLNKNENP